MDSNCSCDHVYKYKSLYGLCTYDILHAYYTSCIADGALKKKARECLCTTLPCDLRYQRVHACLYCIYFGCFNNRHIHEHAKTTAHILAMDTNFGTIYCFICGDYRYDAAFEKIAKAQQWQAIQNGLRGIVNMGNTCYISVILQSLVHAPLFRDYFLSYDHKCSEIESRDQIRFGEIPPSCFACELTSIVQEFFSGKEEPFIPNRLLHLLWNREDQLKGYKQQDAHEFLLVLLHRLHLNCQGLKGSSDNGNHCECVIDTFFTGSLEYEYTCSKCKNAFTQNSSFKDLSLNLDLESNKAPYSLSLQECIVKNGRYVAQVDCKSCGKDRTFNVQTNLVKLPRIISFHLNQSYDPKMYVSFPEYLDMTPYVFQRKAQSNKNGVPINDFCLFAVVEHTGSPQSGHYKCYIRRHKKHWFRCNDTEVTKVTIEDVLKINAYILFYQNWSNGFL